MKQNLCRSDTIVIMVMYLFNMIMLEEIFVEIRIIFFFAFGASLKKNKAEANKKRLC